MSKQSPDRGGDEKAPKPKRRRRWKIVLIVLAGLVVIAGLLAAFAPQLLSMAPGTRLVVNIINGEIRGAVRIEGLSMSWGGPTRLQGLEVLDPDGRVVLRAPEVQWSAGLWGAINHPEQFKELVSDSPEVTLYQDADGGISLAKAFESRTPKAATGKPQPLRIDHLGIFNATVTIVAHGAPPYALRQFKADLAIETLADLTGGVQFHTPDGSALTGDLALKDLWSQEGDLQPDKAMIHANVVGERMFEVHGQGSMEGFEGSVKADLPALAKQARQIFALPPFELHGTADGHLAIKRVAGGVIRIVPDLPIKGFRYVSGEHMASAHALLGKAVDVRLQGDLTLDKGVLDGHTDLTGDVGRVNGMLHYPLNADWQIGRKWLGAVLAGENAAMPGARFSGSVDLDLARVEDAAPGVLSVRREVHLTGGHATASTLQFNGGDKSTLVASLQVHDVTGLRDGKAIKLAPLDANVDLALVPGTGLNVKRANVTWAGLDVHVSGSPKDKLTAEYQVVVEQLATEAGQFVEISGTHSGHLDGQMVIEPRGNYIAVQVHANAEDLALDFSKDRYVHIVKGTLQHEGLAKLASGRLVRYESTQSEAGIGEVIRATATGWYDFESGAFDATADVPKAQLTAAGNLANGLGAAMPGDWAGLANGKSHFSRASADAPIVAGGAATVDGLTIAGKPVGSGADRKVVLEFENVRMHPDTSSVQMATLRLRSSFANADGGDWRYDAGTDGHPGTFTGTFTVRADVSTSMAVAASVAEAKDLPRMGGSLSGRGSLRSQGDRIQAVLEGGIDNFTLGDGQQAFREKRVSFGYDLTLDPSRESMAVNKASVEFPGLIQATAGGNVTQYASRQVLDLQVKYSGNWPRAVELLHQYFPATKDTISIAGPTSDTFAVQGSVRERQVKLAFGDIRATPGVQWTSANLYGLDLSRADLRPQLANGKLTLPMTTIPGTSGGAVNIGGELDMSGSTYVLKIPGRVKVLDNFRINQKVGEHLLSRINPILGATNKLSGTVSLETTDLVLPLGKEILRGGSGRGHMDLSQVEIVPKGFLGQLAQLSGLNISKGSLVMRPQGVHFVIEKGRLKYDNFRIAMGVVDLTFRGSVGFDDTVEMWVSMPLSSQLIGALKTGLPTDQLLKLVGSVRVEIPIKGTRLAPELDLKAVDLRKLLPNPMKLLGQVPEIRSTDFAEYTDYEKVYGMKPDADDLILSARSA